MPDYSRDGDVVAGYYTPPETTAAAPAPQANPPAPALAGFAAASLAVTVAAVAWIAFSTRLKPKFHKK